MLKNNKLLFIIAAAALTLGIITQIGQFAATTRFKKEQKRLDELNNQIQKARYTSEATKDLLFELNKQQFANQKMIDSLQSRQATLIESINKQKVAYEVLKKQLKEKTTNYRDSSVTDILNFLPQK